MSGVGIEVLGVVVVGLGAAALLYALMHALRRIGLAPAPWLLPAGIGATMIGYSIWSDYSWYDRASDRLPADARILLTGTEKKPWAPWTYLFPVTTRFAALDPASIQRDQPDGPHAQITLVERRGPMLVVGQDFDCEGGRIRPGNGEWQPVSADDPAFLFVCGGGG